MSPKTRVTKKTYMEGKTELFNGEIVERLPSEDAPWLRVLRLPQASETMHDVPNGDGPIRMAIDPIRHECATMGARNSQRFGGREPSRMHPEE